MINPQDINPNAAETLRRWAIHEIQQARSSRQMLEDRWVFWQRQYKALPEKSKKTFPFVGASNLEIAIIAADVETMYARFMGQLFGNNMGLWTTHSFHPDLSEFSKKLREFLRWAEKYELNAYEATSDFVLEVCKLGTSILKTRYHRDQRQIYEFRETEMGVQEAHPTIWVKDHPQLHHVSITDFLVPSSTGTDLQSAPWCAERLLLTWQQLMSRVRQGIYMNPAIGPHSIGAEITLAPIREWWGKKNASRYQNFRQQMNFLQPNDGELFEIWEFWTNYDISARGEPRALVCAVHLESGAYLRADWNPFINQEYPYDVGRYQRQEGQFYGIGICEMGSSTQIEVSTQHNQRIDNAAIANTTLFGARKGGSVKINEPLWPGRIMHLIDEKEFWSIPLGQKYDSTIPNEQMTIQHNQRRTGISDYIMGNVDPAIGYAGVTTNIMQQKEGAKRADQAFREIRRALSGAGMRALELYQQYNQQGKPFLILGEEDGAAVQAILSFPTQLVRFSFGVDISSADTSVSQEVEIRINTLLYQMQFNHMQQSFQLLMMAMNPQMPEPLRAYIMSGLETGNQLLRRIFESHGIQDINRLVPSLQEVLNAGQPQPAPGGYPQQQLGAGPGGMGQGPLPTSGVSNVPPGFGGIMAA